MNEMPDEEAASATAPKRKGLRMPGLSAQILIALGLGIVAGIFFGEMMTVLEPVGEVFIGLLQMTVWPYVVVALIGGLGRLSPKQARSLGLRGGGLLVLFWIIGLTAVLAMVMTFPSGPPRRSSGPASPRGHPTSTSLASTCPRIPSRRWPTAFCRLSCSSALPQASH